MKATYAPICILDVAGEAPVPVPAHGREAIAPILRLGLVRQGLWKHNAMARSKRPRELGEGLVGR
jgi:hypothetical protein